MNTEHPLTETAAAELWNAHRAHNALPFHEQGRLYMQDQTAMLRAAFDAGREHERATPADPHHDPRPWQDCTREDIREGDLARSRVRDLLHVGVAHHQDKHGDWYTEGGYQLTSGTAWPLRRVPAPTPPAEEVELPTEFGDVILNPRWGARSYARAVHLGEGVWAAEVTPGADVYTHLAHDLAAFTLSDGTRARRDGWHEDNTPRFVKVREGEK